jgi:hypothetical protein
MFLSSYTMSRERYDAREGPVWYLSALSDLTKLGSSICGTPPKYIVAPSVPGALLEERRTSEQYLCATKDNELMAMV